MTNKTNSGLVAYAKAQLGLPYWYGTFGNIASQSLFDSKSKQYKSTGYYTKWKDYPTQYGKRVHDCVGLIKGYIWSDTPTSTPKYNATQDKSASGLYSASKEKGVISSFPKKAGQLVFKSSNTSASKIHHVGVYIGDGYVVEAMGHEEGVVKTKFEGAGWTHWSQCPYIEDDSVIGGRSFTSAYAGTYTITGGTVNLRADVGTSAKVLAILKRGDKVTCEGYLKRINGTVWLEVKSGSDKGYMSTKYLQKG